MGRAKSDNRVVTAIFECAYRTEGKGDIETILFDPVGGPTNAAWAARVPRGRLELVMTRPEMIGKFKPGQRYELALIPVAKDAT